MIKIITTILLTGFLSLASYSQKSDASKFINKNAVYFELLGSGLFYSINYDRILWEKPNLAISARIGTSYIPIPESDFYLLGFPIELIFLKGSKNYLEIGLSLLILQSFFDGTSTNSLFAFGRIGYRHQKKNERFIFRIGFTPFIVIKFNDEYLLDQDSISGLPWIGISIGRSF